MADSEVNSILYTSEKVIYHFREAYQKVAIVGN